MKNSRQTLEAFGPALPADISQALLPQIQGYKIAFEGGTHLSAVIFLGKYHITIFAYYSFMIHFISFHFYFFRQGKATTIYT